MRQMEYLKTITDEDVFKSPEFEKPDVFKKRTTVKAVVINNGGEFGFVTNPVHGFYLLAGGGAESNNLEKEIQRECDEEINFEVEVLSEIGRVHEYRNRNAKEYETVCFAVKTIKETNEDIRTEDEKKNDLRVVWLDRDAAINALKDQIEKVEKGKVKFYNTAFNIVRDELFFRTYINTSRED
ncbi:MAG: NUDIX domain-containing protein [Candidatus Wolfebacteria bacterium]|nr:NUDIX domain-containing protein [Candidatus Wolfebacteria bacterium]